MRVQLRLQLTTVNPCTFCCDGTKTRGLRNQVPLPRLAVFYGKKTKDGDWSLEDLHLEHLSKVWKLHTAGTRLIIFFLVRTNEPCVFQ